MLLAVIGVSCLGSNLYAANDQDGSAFDDELNERDFDALRDYLKTKRAIDIAENPSELTISGDLRTEWRYLNETCNGKSLRGISADSKKKRKPISKNDFDIEFNLLFNYSCERTWAVAHVRYDNSAGVDDNNHPCFDEGTAKDCSCAGVAGACNGDPEGYHGSGNASNLALKKAYIGYHLYKDDTTEFDLELGRRGNLYSVFDSNVQFLSRFDGILLKYDDEVEDFSKWYVHGAGFVVDEKVNHFAYVVEWGLIHPLDSSFDLKYSFINWPKWGKNRCGVRNPRGFRFQNSQLTLIYHVDPKYCYKKPFKVYGAVLWNAAARNIVRRDSNTPNVPCKNSVLRDKYLGKQNMAWYAGIMIGKVLQEGDWSLEIQYQYVQAQAVPDNDIGGISRGNVLDESFTTCSWRGNTNYKGWKIEGLYAFTDNFSLDTIIEWTKACDSRIGGSHTYSKFEMETVYAF